MKTKNILTMTTVAMATSFTAPVLAEEIPVPNGSFELVYKPGSTTITADLLEGWTNGIGPNTPMQNGQEAVYSDGTTGTKVDIPGWINTPGIETSYDWLQGSGHVARQNATAPDGEYHFGTNGGGWGNPQGGAVESDAPLTTVTTQGGDLSYTVSMLYEGVVSPVLIELLADGVPLTPSSSVDPPAPHAWDVVSRTYDADSLDGHLGESLTIRVGWGPDATGTQSHLDMVTLDYTPGGGVGFIINEIEYDPETSILKLSWNSTPGKTYAVKYSKDMINWDADLDDGVPAGPGKTTTAEFNLSDAGLAEDERVFYRVEKL